MCESPNRAITKRFRWYSLGLLFLGSEALLRHMSETLGPLFALKPNLTCLQSALLVNGQVTSTGAESKSPVLAAGISG